MQLSRPWPHRPRLIASLIAFAFTPAVQADDLTAQAVTAYPTELKWSPQLQQIGVPTVWAQGATGKNVTVSVIDTGVNARHTDLKASVLPGYNTSSPRLGKDTSDSEGHGTHVAGIIAAAANNAGSVGVAPEAKILPIRVSDRWGNMSYAAVERGLQVAADYSPIANASLGGGPGAEAGVRYAVGKGMLLVAAAGNEGAANPSWPARYAKESWALGRIIAVGAVDSNNAMPSWSNKAGDTRNFYLVAPGVDIISTYGSGYAYMSGTSMASPHVAGVAALVKSYWPQLKAEEIASILFQTATDLGAPGVDEIYGWGLVNATKAMQPVGATMITTKNSTKAPSASLKLAAPAASGGALKAKSLHTVATDDFGRGFVMDVSTAISTQAAPALAASLQDAGRRNMMVERVLPDGSRYMAEFNQLTDIHLAAPNALAQYETAGRPQASLAGFALVSRQANGREWAAGGNGLAAHFFGSASELTDTRAAAADFANPMFSLVPRHTHLGVGLPLAGGWKLKTGLLTTTAADSFADQSSQPVTAGTTQPRANLWVGGISRVSQAGAISLTAGQLAENDALLGAQGASVLRMEGRLQSRFATLDGAVKLRDGWAGFASYTLMTTPAQANAADSLITAHSSLRGDAVSFGLMRADAFKSGDRLSFAVSQPLRLRSGSLDFDLPQAQDENGNLQFAKQSVGLSPAGREVRTELRYAAPAGRDAQISTFLMHRASPGHDATAPDDLGVGLRWSKLF
ncbi:MAG: hypothetical protein RIR70_586 [Pseudomonadota bacterium]